MAVGEELLHSFEVSLVIVSYAPLKMWGTRFAAFQLESSIYWFGLSEESLEFIVADFWIV